MDVTLFHQYTLKIPSVSLSCYREDAREREQKHMKTVIVRQVRSLRRR